MLYFKISIFHFQELYLFTSFTEKFLFQLGSQGPAADAGDDVRDVGTFPRLGKSPEGEHGNPLQ